MSFLAPEGKLWQTLESIARDEGLSLYDVEQHGRNILRVYVDRVAPPDQGIEGGVDRGAGKGGKGVTSGDCSRLVRRLMVYFQAQGPSFGLITEPEIEVSSPGVNRSLRLGSHYVGAVGERVKILAGDAPALVGVMQSVSDNSVVVCDELSRELKEVAFAKIRRAAVEFKF